MPTLPANTIAIIGDDTDFTQPLAEQVRRELSMECIVITEENAIDAPALIVTARALKGTYACPVVTLKSPPLRLRDVLGDIESALLKQADDISLSGGYMLQLRQKQLVHNRQSVALTDKEMQLIQCIASAGSTGVSKEQLLKDVWGIDVPMDTHTLETHIYRLRGKCRELSGDDIIEAIDGGYRLK